MDLKSQIEFYKRKFLLMEDKTEKILAEGYLRRARNNIVAMQIDYEVSENEKIQKLINILGFKEYDWVVVKGYYAMYMASLACLAKLGLKSENHNTTISAIEFYFVEKGKLEKNYLEILKNVSLEREYIDSMKLAKEDRITAQYNVSEEFEKRKAEEMISNAKAFVDRMEKLFYEIVREEEKRRKQEEEKKRVNGEKREKKEMMKRGKSRMEKREKSRMEKRNGLMKRRNKLEEKRRRGLRKKEK